MLPTNLMILVFVYINAYFHIVLSAQEHTKLLCRRFAIKKAPKSFYEECGTFVFISISLEGSKRFKFHLRSIFSLVFHELPEEKKWDKGLLILTKVYKKGEKNPESYFLPFGSVKSNGSLTAPHNGCSCTLLSRTIFLQLFWTRIDDILSRYGHWKSFLLKNLF